MKNIHVVKKIKTIGILGGMGPVSSAHFYSEILNVCQQNYGVKEEADYPEIIIYSMAMKGSSGAGFDDTALPQMVNAIRKVEAAGADFVVIPCNTAYHYADALQSAIGIPLVSMIDLVLAEAVQRGWKTLGLMGSEMTVHTGLYRKAAEKRGIRIIDVTSEEQKTLVSIIDSAIAGQNGEEETRHVCSIIEGLQNRGAEGVILGCTEIPLVIKQRDTTVPLLDSVSILAHGSVDYAFSA